MLFIIIPLVLLILLLSVAAYFFYLACSRSYHSSKSLLDTTPFLKYKEFVKISSDWVLAQSPEEVFITSRDGLKLSGLFLKNGESSKTVLMMHGYRAPHGGMSDFCAICPYYYKLGYNILMIDQRAHGRSEGKYICFGIKERYDCADWAFWIENRVGIGTHIILDGISMGASTVLMASTLPLPQGVNAIVADCGFTSAFDECMYVTKTVMHLPPHPLLDLVNLFAILFAKFSLRECSAESELSKNSSIPVLFIHGSEDTFVPLFMGERNYAACKSLKKLVVIEGASHAMSYLMQPEKYQAALSDFLSHLE
ncbi:MAG: alpha/beta hydrolase [Oscillospiraceae bacterium]